MIGTLEKRRLEKSRLTEIPNIFQLVSDSHPQLVHNAPKRREDNWLSRELFQKISRRPGFFIFVGKGFESQWLCQNMPLRHGARTRPR
ncbi:hypothetical protein EN792_026140 [Mesorhizobium sp. M00.F.Ca.ET.149.01.1.1]|nr:hypothetical protein EN792_026140 [Mesorhizobium sp. M00.F.Ca.ET.149.01.1.1]